MEITRYNTDSGSRDLSTEKSFDNTLTFIEILQEAYKMKAYVITKTIYVNEHKQGKWYVKGFNGKFTYLEIKDKIEKNLLEGKYPNRLCYLIKYY
tara:strand:+ start:1096 stop:1380 length:285 start_codon:yes stop_codon:yes gene_type:complete